MDWDKLQEALVYKPRKYNTSPKLTQEDVTNIRDMYSTGDISTRKLGVMFGVNASTILRIIRREIW